MPRRGPKASVDPARLVRILDGFSYHEVGGHPVLLRKFINGQAVSETDARMIRRWRAGTIQGVTKSSARAILRRHNLDPRGFIT